MISSLSDRTPIRSAVRLRRRSLACMALALVALGRAAAAGPNPIIDVHLHTIPPEQFMPGGALPSECALPSRFPAVDPREGLTLPDYLTSRQELCGRSLPPARSEAELISQTVERLERYDIYAVASGSAETLARWEARAPGRIIRAGQPDRLEHPDVAALTARIERGELEVFAEIAVQYAGLAPADSALAPFWALAESLDRPVGIHMGLSAAGVPALGFPGYRASLSDPLGLEPVLIRHPRLRVYVMHAGWPMQSEIIHMLYSHPQLYVDVAVLNWHLPRREFHRYLEALVVAGFEDRILFGSDQMIWPGAIDVAVDSIETAAFLGPKQKRAIFYDNAARFLGLSAEQIAAHHED